MRDEIREKKFDAWRHGLLDISRRNRLINYRKSKRMTLQIVEPPLSDLYQRVVMVGESLSFRRQIDVSDNLHLSQLFYIMEKMDAPVELAMGEVRSDLSATEMNQTLRNLRAKAKLSQEEQGINILYLSFGFLKWKPKPSDPYVLSPLILVPVVLELESILSPFTIRRHEEDIVVNPTLEYVLSSDYGITLPEIDPLSCNIETYLEKINTLVNSNGWSVEKEVSLGLLSFLKIVMYKDLEKYKDRIFANPVIQAFCGGTRSLPPLDESLRHFPHDDIPAIETCQVVNADATQQDAILLSRKGASFVLQGPPGTGKSQTITNMIAQALADGKKVLFVSQKMAALSVVYRRLEEVGLADYCLSLHNYKAERRAVIQDLVNTLEAPTKSVKAGVTDALSVLEEERHQLNVYVEEMNRPRMPLNKSIFDVVTELGAQDNGPLFQIPDDVTEITEKELGKQLTALRKLGDFLEHDKGNIFGNPWRGSNLTSVTFDVRNMVTRKLDTLTGYLSELSETLDTFDRTFGQSHRWSTNEFNQLIQMLIGGIINEDLQKVFNERSGVSVSRQVWLSQVIHINIVLQSRREAAIQAGIDEKKLDDLTDIEKTRSLLKSAQERLVLLEKIIQSVSRITHVPLNGNDQGLRQTRQLLKVLNTPYYIPGDWLEDNHLLSLKADCRKWKGLADKVTAIRKQIDASWEQGFYQLDAETLIERFSHSYKSFLRRLGPGYKADKAKLASLRKGQPSRLEDSECLDGLMLLDSYRHAMADFEAAACDAAERLFAYYRGVDTDWQRVLQILNACEPVLLFFDLYGYSESVVLLMEKTPRDRLTPILEALEITDVGTLFGMLDGDVPAEGRTTGYREAAQHLESEITLLEHVAQSMTDCKKVMDLFSPVLRPGTGLFGQLALFFMRFLSVMASVRKREIQISDFMAAHQISVDGERLPEVLRLFDDYIDVQRKDETVQDLLRYCLDLSVDRQPEAMDNAEEGCELYPQQMEILFSFDEWFPDKDLMALTFDELSGFIASHRNIEALQSWLRFSEVCDRCKQLNIHGYIDFVEQEHLQPENIVTVYRKSFLNKWLIDIMARDQVPYLQNFQSYAHEKTIEGFRTSDENQMKIAQARLVEYLSHEKPSGMFQLATAMDEVTILRREAEKKRRITPLRRLFKTIPTLMQKLKPCFMMSPLSVSYFLDSDRYQFDLVIFDEASQILPEDAIGAIYRGKQVVIAGDTKQMPPTSFFSTVARNTDEYDTDEDSDEFYPDVISESVLDEAAACLPSCTLLWHYRSRDESLIAFSNQHLYNNRLITFPNAMHLEDRGLEYVYVPGGYYEGSGRNCNLMEARKCLALVIEHMNKHPDRSLGIIAFSEKQQAVIEEVIGEYRLQNPQHEDFFNEAKDEPFFVKNLENVQGDERDTIIFSICYAKNAQGRMYQRFGPLGHEGGERRLNVAITRAKYNVKLVGSIMPTDIVVREGTREGIRMLRDYIYYAMQNDAALRGENPDIAGEAFAGQIAAFVAANGYTVRRNVGSSHYRVDIAIEKPDAPGQFLAGIECDGSVYAETRTARDRDVLRRKVMTALGWHLIHVWSMGWHLNPEKEKTRLLEFLEECGKADSNPPETGMEMAKPTQELTKAENLTDTEKQDDKTQVLVFETYEYADPNQADHASSDRKHSVFENKILWVLRKEQPIHRDELYRRLVATLGGQKVTVSIKRLTDDAIEHYLTDEVIVRGDFLYLKDAPVVPRTPRPGEEPRTIDHISPEEIQAAMCRILEFALGLTAKDLVRETSRQLGYQKIGSRINNVLLENCQAAIALGKIRETDGKLTIAEEEKK